MCIGAPGGFNWLSQHLDSGGGYGPAATGCGSCGSPGDEVAGHQPINAAEYGGPAPANNGERHPEPDSYTPAKSEEPAKARRGCARENLATTRA